jgi:Leucine-rich repeat (LRR) protein
MEQIMKKKTLSTITLVSLFAFLLPSLVLADATLRDQALASLHNIEFYAYVGNTGTIGWEDDATAPSILYRLMDENLSNDNGVIGSSNELLNELDALEAIIHSLDLAEEYEQLESESVAATGFTFTKRLEILMIKLDLISERILDGTGVNNENQEDLVIYNLDECHEIDSSLIVRLNYCVFQNPELDKAVHVQLSIPYNEPITLEQGASVDWLKASDYGIENLEGIECLVNITSLDLRKNQINDLSPLANLTTLISLDLRSNQIDDLSPLAELTTNLHSISLAENQISDLSPLAGLTQLTSLDLDSNQISNLIPLAGLTKLTTLGLSSNQISILSPLSGMTGMHSLRAANNQITDIDPLAGMTGLENLNLANNQIGEVDALSGMINLTFLRINANQIDDISPLSGLTDLDRLIVNHNQVYDVGPLVGLTNLWYLDLDSNQVEDISPFQAWTGDELKILLHYNPLSDSSKDLIPELLEKGIEVVY